MCIRDRIIRGAIDGLIDQAGAVGRLARVARQVRDQTGLGWALVLFGAYIVSVNVMGGSFRYLGYRWAAMASERIIRGLRERLYAHLQHVPMAYHDKAQTGDLVQRCTSDVDTVRNFYGSQATDLVLNSLRLLIAVPILLVLDWKLALVSVSLMPVIIG